MRVLLFVLIGFTSFNCTQLGGSNLNTQHQTYENFLIDFKSGISSNFSERDMKALCTKYPSFLLVGYEPFPRQFSGHKPVYPLAKLKEEPLYRQNIAALLRSTNPYQRMLGCVTTAAAGDESFNQRLLESLQSDPSKECQKYACAALLRLRDKHTSEIFNYLVENKDCAPLQALYLHLDTSSIRHTAYTEINSERDQSKIFAMQSLCVTKLCPKTEEIVKQAITDWSPTLKVYAIETAGHLRMSRLKKILEPLTSEGSLRKSCLAALASSSTSMDQEYLSTFVPDSAEVPNDVLNAYLKSPYESVVRQWLDIVRDRKVSDEYTFSVFSQPLLLSDKMLEQVRETIKKTHNLKVKAELTRSLKGR